MRKHCATSIENNTDRISSQFLDSGGNSGETGRNQNGGDINGNSGSGAKSLSRVHTTEVRDYTHQINTYIY